MAGSEDKMKIKLKYLLISMFMVLLIISLNAKKPDEMATVGAITPIFEQKPLSILGQQELEQLNDLLHREGFKLESLSFEKDWDLSTKGKSAWHIAALQNPLLGMRQIQDLRFSCAETELPTLAAELLNKFSTIAWDTPDAMEIYRDSKQHYTACFLKEVKKPADIFAYYTKYMQELSPSIREAYSKLSTNQLSSLKSLLLSSVIEEEDVKRYAGLLGKTEEMDSDNAETLINLSSLINEASLQRSSLQFLALSDVIAENAINLKLTNRKPIIKESEFGLMILGTKGSDTYNSAKIKALNHKSVCLLIDPSGDDVYEFSLNTGKGNPGYLLIDYCGNDVYRSTKPAEMFFSFAGNGVSYDMAGNDIYQLDDFAFSSCVGSNIHFDASGDDTYRSGLFSSGAAILGVSLLIDMEGRDRYMASGMAQGFGGFRAVGSLLDYSGADLYQVGGKYLHAPLMPNDFRSMGQGMGFGMRPDLAGGLGLLYDKAGNDQYLGGVYAQGVGYWYATGVLIDEAGNDVYNAVYYPQGSGIHLASGFLYDGGGDDAYYSRNGPGQGAGHDWGLGVLVDESGNDAYSIHGGNGLGLSNSVGIFVDKKGNDRYERNEAQNYGNAAASRSSGGLGIFLDTGGKDSYPDSLMADGKNWKKGVYGLGKDVELYPISSSPDEPEVVQDSLVAENAAIDAVFAAAAEWEVGSSIQRVRAARKVLSQRSQEAQEYMVNNKLNSKSGLEYRALEAFLKDNPGFKAKLYDFVLDADSLKAKTAMSLIAGTGDAALLVPIKQHLQNKRYVTSCLSLLGSIKSSESVEILRSYTFHPSERYRYLTARSLLQISTPQSLSALSNMSYDESFLVQALIRNKPEVKP
ncbi:MAG: HEAT repeat domain-containing protein [Candidatus Cloacimonetes bacterium]|nr:HEAT repeat domain-containing protein [Candidatus Cloacimonadota bacterium]